MKSEREIRKYLDAQGIAFTEPIYDGEAKLRLLDVTRVPQLMRGQFDERGFFIAPKDEPSEEKGKKK